ncbi:MAG: PBSX family phage terminase large subunit [Oscillospiraceae bacterium]|jgi:PBSX family phage terminase large subunit|nr:PBSX family phage terminase large subunit [Oscillospiraceae bacterium]
MISSKQKKILAFPYSPYDALICDGAVRSGKTSIMVVAFSDWAMREFSGQRFGICGKTVGSATENIIIPYISMTRTKKKYTAKWRRSQKILEVRSGRKVNYFEVFGGRDESSYALIQGRTLAGVLLDEVVLMPESFVNQALARCSVEGAKFWFSCNPGNPNHWFKREWIDKREEHNALYLHFEMTDNPSLSEKTLARYQSMYSGVFYDRYVRGMWVPAEGLVYPMFSKAEHVVDEIPWQALQRGRWYISLDYGTVNPTAAGLWCLWKGTAYMAGEYYYDSRAEDENGYGKNPRRTDEEHYAELEKLAGDRRIERVVVDPSAASFKETVRRHKRFAVWGADNSVLDGIRLTASLLNAGRILIHQSCKGILSEFGQYRWDMDAPEDAVIKEFDHGMDQLRYFCATIMEREVRGNGI